MTTNPDLAAAKTPPSPRGFPLIGHRLHWANKPLEFPTKCAREYGDVVKIRLGRMPTVLLSHPDHIKYVLAENNQNYYKGAYFHEQLDSVLGQGLFTAEGETWRRHRHLIDPLFRTDRIKQYGDRMTAFVRELADSWATGGTRDVNAEMSQLTLRIAADAFFNVDVTDDEASEIAHAITTVMEHFQQSRSQIITRPDWLPSPRKTEYRRAIESFNQIVYDIIEDRKGTGVQPPDLVSRLLNARDTEGSLTETEIRDQLVTLMLAGHETSSLVLTYTLYLLATHPGVERTLLDELETVLGGDLPTISDLPDLPFTEKVVKESMRVYPPVYFITREPYEDDVIGGYAVPGGTFILINQWVVHRDPRFYSAPAKFRPDRWTETFERDLHPFAYIPFSGGPRRCLGDRFAMMEARLVIATLLQRYRVESVTEEPLEFAPRMTLRPKTPIELVPTER